MRNDWKSVPYLRRCFDGQEDTTKTYVMKDQRSMDIRNKSMAMSCITPTFTTNSFVCKKLNKHQLTHEYIVPYYTWYRKQLVYH